MEEDWKIGQIICHERTARGLTQAELCSGLCEPSTMSKIETGAQQPSRANMVALLQRLGIMGDRYYGVRNVKELEQEDLKQQIKNANAKFEYEEAIRLLDKLEEKFDCTGHIEQQFVLWSRAINGRMADGAAAQYSYQEQLSMLEEAIRYTVPRLDLEKIDDFFLCLDEMIIIVNIANLYSKLGDNGKAIDIYRDTLKCAQRNILQMSDKAQIIPLITYNYSTVLGREERGKEELAIAEVGIACCVEYGKSRLLGELLINKACALHRLGREPEGKQVMIRAFHVLVAMEQWSDIKIVREHFQKTYNCDLG